MLQTYQGYFEQGRFISPEVAAIPERARVIVTLVDEDFTPLVKTRAQQQLEAVREFLSDTSGKGELTAEDYAELESGKYRFSMGGRTIDL